MSRARRLVRQSRAARGGAIVACVDSLDDVRGLVEGLEAEGGRVVEATAVYVWEEVRIVRGLRRGRPWEVRIETRHEDGSASGPVHVTWACGSRGVGPLDEVKP